ncbi:MAG: SLC13/DASS family transporter [Candidatus Zixiibacteriota bacterium]|nr:MAG: SLC13/DASS family transporter [candidate division Zixibacteria bacterium]
MALLMAIWWVTEAIPIPATAMIPVALFPLMGIMSGNVVAGQYFNNIIFLFIGGFIMALAMERWNLHRRIALRIILLIGASPRKIILGFMIATAFLSMWISNTATTMMMMPIAMAVIVRLKEEAGPVAGRFSIGLLLGIAYAASIGGIATLIGTPPNLAFSRIYQISFPNAPEISFAQWMSFGLPLSVVLLVIAWLLLTFMFVRYESGLPSERAMFREEHRRLGPMAYEEKMVLVLFALLALLWIFRRDITIGSFILPGWSHLFAWAKYIDDGTVGITIAMILFLLPSKNRPGERLMNWATAVKLNWGIVILFGGGFALAAGFKESGLSAWVAQSLQILQGAPTVLLVLVVCVMLMLLTELTSNTATTQIVLPLLASLAVAIKVHPLLLMIPATLSASCAFMLPVATPPNAIVFGTGEVRMGHMIRAGVLLNLCAAILITLLIFLWGRVVFDLGI